MITNRTRRSVAFAVVAAFVLAACDGGSGDNVAGIDRTGAPAIAAYGTVNAFGSIAINGVHYDTSGATFTIDGEAGEQGDLGIGDVVLVKGTLDDGGTTGVATSVRFDNNVEGPIASIDWAAAEFVVLGQVIRVNADTSFDGAIRPPVLSALAVGDFVDVSGLVQNGGSINATRIKRRPASDQVELTGRVASNQAVQGLFAINAQIVDYQLATLKGFPGDAVGNRQRVLVKGSLMNDVVRAISVEYLSDEFRGASGELREVEGWVTRFTSTTDFAVSGLPVTTDAQTVFEQGTAADLALNVKVEVEGSLNDAGVLAATNVAFRLAAPVRIVAPVDSVSNAASSFAVLGIAVQIDVLTRLEDQSPQQLRPFALANVDVGDIVEVRGTETPAGGGTVLAALVERRAPQQDARLQGFVQSVTPPLFTVLGVQIATNGGTKLDGIGSLAQLAVGDLVKVVGQKLGDRAIDAREVRVESESDD